MPESRLRRKTAFTPPPPKAVPLKPNGRWFLPVMVGLLLIGLVWIVVCRRIALPRPLPRQRSRQVDPRNVFAGDEDLAERLAGLLLLGKRGIELVGGQAPLVNEHLAHVGPAVGLCSHRDGTPPDEDAQRTRGGSFE